MGTQTHIGTKTHGRGKGTAVSNRYDEKIKAVRAAAVAEGTAAGLAEGRMQGLAQGRAEGRLEGLLEGRAEGRKQGVLEGAVF